MNDIIVIVAALTILWSMIIYYLYREIVNAIQYKKAEKRAKQMRIDWRLE